MSAFLAVFRRDLVLAWRTGGTGLALMFFVLTIVLLPFASGTLAETLLGAGPGLVWIAVLLAVLLTLDRMFQTELESGVLDVMIGASLPLELIVVAKIFAHWLGAGVPLALLSLGAAVLLGIPTPAGLVLAASLLIGTPGLSATGAVIAALTASVRRGSLLLSLLCLPLFAPFVIFGAGAATLAANPAPPLTPGPSLLLLGASSLLAIALALAFAAKAARSQVS